MARLLVLRASLLIVMDCPTPTHRQANPTSVWGTKVNSSPTAEEPPRQPDAASTRTRRVVLTAGVVAATAAALGAAGLSEASIVSPENASDGSPLALTPSCHDGDDTPSN